MIQFDEGYFKDEYRDGFFIPEKMKRAWAAMQEVLSEIIRVCEKYDIAYYADYGTLLGAVRHKGFVPWDDDVDISVQRKDYERLFKILPSELPESYVVKSVYNTKMLESPTGCVMNRKTVETDASKLDGFHGCPYIVGVDVFALDNIPDDEELAQTHTAMYNIAYDVAQRFDELKGTGELWGYLPQIEEICRVSLVRDDTLNSQLWVLADRIASLFAEDECQRVASMTELMVEGKNHIRQKKWMETVEKLPFENIMINVPNGYDNILKVRYGDYMTPVRGTAVHDYPFYKIQDEWLMARGLLAPDGTLKT